MRMERATYSEQPPGLLSVSCTASTASQVRNVLNLRFSGGHVWRFFGNSELLDHAILRPLDHIRANWELTWDPSTCCYFAEDDSFAGLLNALIHELGGVVPPARYHDHEDRLAEYLQAHLGWKLTKIGQRWVGEDYDAILEQGGFHDIDEANLILAAAGRVQAARIRGQAHFDQMEGSHRRILAAVLSIILYHRVDLTED